MEKLVIRRALICEQRQLEELQGRASLSNAGDREALLAHPDAIELPLDQIVSGEVFVCEADGVIAGFAAMPGREDGDRELDALFVEPDMRRRGVGRELVEYCVRRAREQGSVRLHVVGNPHAKEFYLACGFTVTGSCETRFGLGLAMHRAI